MTLKAIVTVVLLGAALMTGTAAARTAAVPRNTSAPTVTGTAREGNTLAAHNGGWANSPTSFAYQWQRCGADGTGCADISGATKQSYTLTSDDADHTVRVQVTASNADGQAAQSSAPTSLVSSRSAPQNTARPAVSGTPKVGEELSASNGTWTGGVSSYSYQWQRCTSSTTCADVDGATARTYGVRSADVGDTLRVAVTAHNASGSTASATSDPTATVVSNVPSPKPAAHNRRPTLSILSLKRIGVQVYARFRTCDDSTARLNVTQRDTKLSVAAYTRHFLVKGRPCSTYSRHWFLPSRFRHGRYTATLQARDRLGAMSQMRHRTLFFA